MENATRWLLGVVCLVAFAACSGGGSGSGGGDGSGIEGDDTFLLPLIGEPANGLTRDLLEPVLEAASEGLGYDFSSNRLVSLPSGAPSQLLIRPGTQILPESLFPGWCTAAFVFDGRSKIATAGHCTRVGDAVLAVSLPSTVFAIGRTVESTGDDSEVGNDWALIEIFPEWRPFVDPAVALVGGPCGRAGDGFPPLLKYVGHALGIGTGGLPRAGLYAGTEDGAFVALGPIDGGDSGGPVLEVTQTDPATACIGGGAVGIITHRELYVVAGAALVPTGYFHGTPISRIGNALDDGAPLP
ncbi:MAG: hypothetical protein ACREQJ_10630 [Candidatus Binatia bacterium]